MRTERKQLGSKISMLGHVLGSLIKHTFLLLQSNLIQDMIQICTSVKLPITKSYRVWSSIKLSQLEHYSAVKKNEIHR